MHVLLDSPLDLRRSRIRSMSADTAGSTLATSSMARQAAVKFMSTPPMSLGTSMPMRPCSKSAATTSEGIAALRSISATRGAKTSLAKRSALLRSSSSSSESACSDAKRRAPRSATRRAKAMAKSVQKDQKKIQKALKRRGIRSSSQAALRP